MLPLPSSLYRAPGVCLAVTGAETGRSDTFCSDLPLLFKIGKKKKTHKKCFLPALCALPGISSQPAISTPQRQTVTSLRIFLEYFIRI